MAANGRRLFRARAFRQDGPHERHDHHRRRRSERHGRAALGSRGTRPRPGHLARADELRQRGIRQPYLYGSLARGTGTSTSDIDLYAVVDPGARWNLLTPASVAAWLEDAVGRHVDFADLATLRPDVRAAAERDAIRVLA